MEKSIIFQTVSHYSMLIKSPLCYNLRWLAKWEKKKGRNWLNNFQIKESRFVFFKGTW